MRGTRLLKSIGRLTEIRQRQLGVAGYRWSTSLDERVRDTHAANEGLFFRWDDPPAITGHPGEDIQCRCVGIPTLAPSERNRLKEMGGYTSGSSPVSPQAKVPAPTPRPTPKLLPNMPEPKLPPKPVEVDPKTLPDLLDSPSVRAKAYMDEIQDDIARLKAEGVDEDLLPTIERILEREIDSDSFAMSTKDFLRLPEYQSFDTFSEAAQDYFQYGYKDWNARLRQNKKLTASQERGTEEFKSRARALSKDRVLFRMQDEVAEYTNAEAGKVLDLDAFTSTTSGVERVMVSRSDTLLELHPTPGVKAVVENYQELETVFPPGHRLYVREVYGAVGRFNRYIVAQVLPPLPAK